MKSTLHAIVFPSILAIVIFGCQMPANEGTEHSLELPNIVLIVADDLGYPYAGFMGDTIVQTPTLDKLAGMGTVFTHGMVTQSYCAPSLRAIITGLHSARYDFLSAQLQKQLRGEKTTDLSPEDSLIWEREFQWRAMPYFHTIPEYLTQKGYVSYQGGKWWEFNYQNGGFTDGMTTGWTKEDRKGNDFFHFLMGGTGLALGRVTNQPVFDFVENNREKPFFVWWAPDLPHWPFNAGNKYLDLYQDMDLSQSARKYYANVSWFDDALGELMAYFESEGLMENTLFIYVNDNGWDQAPSAEYRNDSLLWHTGGPKGKGSYFDQTFRTPLIFSWQGKTAPKYNHELVSAIDILPTVLDYAAIDQPAYLPGSSLRGNIEGKSATGKEYLVGNINQLYDYQDKTFFMGKPAEGFWLRNDQYHYVWDIGNQTELLFDMKNDPANERNIASENQELIAVFKSQIHQWNETQKVPAKPGELE